MCVDHLPLEPNIYGTEIPHKSHGMEKINRNPGGKPSVPPVAAGPAGELDMTPIWLAVIVVFVTISKYQHRNFRAITYHGCDIIISLSIFIFSPFLSYFFLQVLLWVWKRKRSARTDVLLTGLCDSGKTLLFSQLVLGEEKESFTSIKENLGVLQTTSGELRLVDIPGHERLRGKFFDQYKNLTKAVIFVVDSVTVQKEIRDVAE